MDQLPDIVSLLKESNPEVRFQAVKLLCPFSQEVEGRAKLVELDAITILIRMLGDHVSAVVHYTLIALINLSESEQALQIMLKKKLIHTIVDCITEESTKFLDFYASLMSNLTRTREGTDQMQTIGLRATKLLKTLLPAYIDDPVKRYMVGLCLVNISQCDVVRQASFDKSVQPLLAKLIPIIYRSYSKETMAYRRVVLKYIRNLCFSEWSHVTLLEELDILTHLLTPLRGSDLLDADDVNGMSPSLHAPRTERENDSMCQSLILESLALLTATRKGRVYIREHKAYPILRDFDKTVDESSEEMKEAVLRVVHVILADEGERKDQYDQPSSVEIEEI